MALARATIREKLNLLLLVPLLATVLLALPFVASRIDDARAASITADAATNARRIADLLYAVQRERLAAMDHVVDMSGHKHLLMVQQEATVDDAAADLRADLTGADPAPLTAALEKVDRLKTIRRLVTEGKARPEQVFREYGKATHELLDALGLDVRTFGSTGAGRQLETLDALLRANEQSSRMGAALLVAAINVKTGRDLLVEADAVRRLEADRFVRVARPDQAETMRTVDEGRSTRLLTELTEQVRVAEESLGQEFVASARDVAEAQAVLRQLLLIQTVRQVETASRGSADRAGLAAWIVGAGTLLMFALVVALGVAVSRSIARPVRHLTRAATAVAELARTELARVSDSELVDDRPPRLAAIAVRSRDEVGDLAGAFNQVQATAALLLERQVHTRQNVGLMFASVARRTQNLVGGQLALIDQLERDEQNPKLLAELYRLDHLSMRLRRSAESLLVVSGIRDETRIAVPAQLATVLRSALAEIEDFRRVRLVSVCDVTVAPDLVADLSLLLAELLENATSYSPPTTVVDVSAERFATGCQITIADHGIGLSAEQLARENERFVQRERLDIAPTTVLGLFVVGRLARRHGMSVVLRPTPGGGVTAVIDVPLGLLAAELVDAPRRTAISRSEVRGRVAAMPPALVAAPSTGTSSADFVWFAKDGTDPPDAAPPPPGTPAARPSPRPSMSHRPSPHLPSHDRAPQDRPAPRPLPPAPSPLRRSSHAVPPDGATSTDRPSPRRPRVGTGDADPPPAEAGQRTRGGLTRRVPGANLSSDTRPRHRDEPPRYPTGSPPISRDPEQERAALDAFTSALARAAAETETDRQPGAGGVAGKGSTG